MAITTTTPRFLLPRLSWRNKFFSSSTALPSLPPALLQSSHLTSATTSRSVILATPVSFKKVAQPYNAAGCCIPSIRRTRCFSTNRIDMRDHHFDTLKFVQRLRSEGFSEEQSRAMMLVLSDVIEESIQNLTRTMVLKEGQSGRLSCPDM